MSTIFIDLVPIDALQATQQPVRQSRERNLSGRFDRSGLYLARAHRGCAFADFNNDGKIDIVVSALGEPAELWQNVSPDEPLADFETHGYTKQPRWDRRDDPVG